MSASAQPTALWLIRHPEPQESARGRCYGALDISLGPRGIEQAHELAARFTSEPLAAIYTSHRRRCREAAEILAGQHCRPIDVPALRERDFGQCEGRSYEEIATIYPDVYDLWMSNPTEAGFPGGEPLGDVCLRVRETIRDLRLRHAGRSILLMTHAGVIRIVLADALGMPLSHMFRLGQRYAAINQVRYFGDTPVVEIINGT